jgi:ABC-type nitrate/sulfonate/bicarbonate transport system substrate-binding protein
MGTVRRQLFRLLGAALVLSVLAACGGDDGGGETGTDGGDKTVRFVFSPDPVWNWLEDQGILAKMEQESGITIERFESEDEFAFFAGGHADIVSTGSYETPVLESENGVPTVTIGKYNKAKDIVVVAADKPYETFADLPKGCKVGVESFSGSTIVWQALAKDLDGRTLAESPDDLQMAITDFDLAPELVVKGDLCAGVTSVYNAIPFLMSGQVKGLYDSKSASQLYEEQYEPGHEGMMSNNFIALNSWYEEHPEEVAFFLKVWQRGLDEWATNKDAILAAYPDDFGYANQEELDFLKNWYETQFDEFVDSVYLDEEWINGEAQVTELLREAGLISEDQPQPTHVCIDPETGEETCRIPS